MPKTKPKVNKLFQKWGCDKEININTVKVLQMEIRKILTCSHCGGKIKKITL